MALFVLIHLQFNNKLGFGLINQGLSFMGHIPITLWNVFWSLLFKILPLILFLILVQSYFLSFLSLVLSMV